MHEPRHKRAWVAQRNWNDKMRVLWKGEGEVKVHAAPDYSAKALDAWIVSQSITMIHGAHKVVPNVWWRAMHALLQKEPKSMTGFSFMPKGEVQ